MSASGLEPLAGLNVLFVDDNADAREIIPTLLEYAGALVMVAAGAKEALEKLQTLRPEVIVTDLNMPGMDGYAFIRGLLASDTLRDVPVIALTAMKGPEHERRVREAGFGAYLAKPVDADTIIDAIRRVVRPRTE